MGLISAMNTALTGLTAAETQIDVAGNNLANSQTTAFKSSRAVFSEQLVRTLSFGAAPSATSGGTIPRQIGLGTRVAAIQPDFSQGSIATSGSPTDVAIQGDGFFILENVGGGRVYTRNGEFSLNAVGEFVSIGGARLLGYVVDDDFVMQQVLSPLQIPLGQQIAVATQNVTWGGILSPDAAIADTASILASEPLGDATTAPPGSLGPGITASTLLTDVVRLNSSGAQENVFPGTGTLQFTGRKNGMSGGTQDFSVGAASTVGDLVNFMSAALGTQTNTDPVNPIPPSTDPSGGTVPPGGSVQNGMMQLVGNNGIPIEVSALGFVDANGNAATVNLAFGEAQAAAGESVSASFLAYDSLGVPIDLRVHMVLEDRDNNVATYRWFAETPDNQPSGSGFDAAVGTGLVSFGSDGALVSTTNTSVNVERNDVPSSSPLSFNFDFSEVSALATDSSGVFVNIQDGAATGTLTSFSFGEDGRLSGNFSNGQTRVIGQLRMAKFANNPGLERRGDGLFVPGLNSGLPLEGNPTEQGIGTLIVGARELSNADVGGSLIDLITASTLYRGNTRLISTTQQLLDELLNIRR